MAGAPILNSSKFIFAALKESFGCRARQSINSSSVMNPPKIRSVYSERVWTSPVRDQVMPFSFDRRGYRPSLLKPTCERVNFSLECFCRKPDFSRAVA